MLDETFTMTLMTTLDPTEDSPVSIDLRIGSNTQWNFVSFVATQLEAGRLKEGDYLILDNASVHSGSDSFPILLQLLQHHGVQLIFLPTYSPELNPCEEIFAGIKNHIRFWRGHARFWEEIIRSTAMVSYRDVCNYYNHAISFD